MTNRVILIATCLISAGCVSSIVDKIEDVFGPDEVETVGTFEVVCNNAFANFELVLEMEDLDLCFDIGSPGFAGRLNDALDGEFTVSVASQCDPSVNPYACTLAFNELVEVTPINLCEGNCEWREGDDGSNCCDYSTDGWPLIDDAQDLAFDLLQAECPNLHAASVQPSGPTNGEDPFNDWEFALCDVSTYEVNDANADYYVAIDPSLSYIAITQSNSSLYASVEGAGSTATSPARFLSAVAWADDATLAGTDYENWRFGLKQPIVVNNNAGAFTVTAASSPLLAGRGEIDGVDSYAAIGLNATATGVMDLVNMTWELDYSESSPVGGSTLSVHFEGAVTTP